jgi:zinc protease
MRKAWAIIALVSAACLLACTSAQPTKSKTPSPTPSSSAAAVAKDPEPWRQQTPAPGAKAVVAYPEPEVERLKNGLTLYVLRRPADTIEVEFVVRHGASSLAEGKSGLAALTARMLNEGTRSKGSLALAEAVESLGTTLDTGAGRDSSSVSLSTLKADFARGLSILAEVVQTPAFSAKEFQRVRNEWLDGLLAERQEPRSLAAIVGLRALLGPVHGAPASGSLPDVKALGVHDLRAFHKQFYAPENSALIIVGDLSLQDAKLQAERLFGAWKARAPVASEKPELPPPPAKPRVILVDRSDAVQTALFVIQPFPKRSVAGHEAREILTNLLGGLFTSRINRNLREEHAYTYGARGQLVATRYWGAFVISTSVKTDVTAKALEQIRAELAKIREPRAGQPITPEELARSKTDLIHSLGAHLEHTSRVAADLASSFAEGLPTDYESRYARLIEALPAEAVAREGARLSTEQLVIVAVGDRKSVQQTLEPAYKVELANPKLLE